MRFTLYVCLLALAGCAELIAHSRDYAEPVSGDMAKVRFSTNGTLRLIPNRSCLDWSSPGSGSLVTTNMSIAGGPKAGGKTLSIKGEAPAGLKSAEVLVAAGQPITVSFSSLTPGMASCDYSFAFVPKRDEEYQVSVWHELSGGGGLCRFEPKSLTNPTQRVNFTLAEQCK